MHHRDRADRPTLGRDQVPSIGQQLVEPAVLAHQAHPRIDAQKERGPERQDDEHQEDVPPATRHPCEPQRHRIAEEQAEDHRTEGIDQRRDETADVEVIGEEPLVSRKVDGRVLAAIAERRRRGRPRRHAHRDDDEERQEEEHQQPEIGRGDDHVRPAAPVEPFGEGGGFAPAHRRHSVSRMAADGSKESQTLSYQSGRPAAARFALTPWTAISSPVGRITR